MLTTCFHCNAEHQEGHYDRVVHNKTPLYGPWSGWHMAGRELVAPDNTRFTPERLRGLAWRDEMELRRAGFASRRRAEKATKHGAKVKVVIVDLADWQAQHFGRSAS